MFDGKLEFVSGGDDILPPVGQRNWPWSERRQLAPCYIATSSDVTTGWDPLWSLECVAARETYLGGSTSGKTFVNRLKGQDIRDVWSSVKSLLSTGRFINDTSSFSDRELANYQQGALPSRYFENSMLGVSDATPYDWTVDYYTRTGAAINKVCWSNIFGMIRRMNYAFPSCSIGSLGSSEFPLVEEASGSLGPSIGPSDYGGLLYWHASSVYYYAEYGQLFLQQYRMRKGEITSIGEFNSSKVQWSAKYGPDGTSRIASHKPGQSNLDAWAIFEVVRNKVNWESLTVEDPITKYVFCKIPSLANYTIQGGDEEFIPLFYFKEMLGSVMSAASVRDDVTIPSKQFIEDNFLWFSNLHQDLLSVRIVDIFPIVKFIHTEVSY